MQAEQQHPVVAAATVDGDRVLAAHRVGVAGAAGGWEFPGGKVEPGESDRDALVREIREELGAEIAVAELIGEHRLDATRVLRLYLAELLSGEVEARHDHDEVRWLTAADLDGLTWLAADAAFLPAVRTVLGA